MIFARTEFRIGKTKISTDTLSLAGGLFDTCAEWEELRKLRELKQSRTASARLTRHLSGP